MTLPAHERECAHEPECALPEQHHLLRIAELWPDLEARLGKQGATDHDGSGRPKKAAGETPAPIDHGVADHIATIQDWTAYLGRTLLDETDWKPPHDVSTPSILRNIAEWRIGHFTQRHDEMVTIAFTEDCEDYHDLALKTARPSGVRRIPLHVQCMNHGTNDQGERVPCNGEYYALLIPDKPMRDMVCSQDEQHRMSPLEWTRAVKRGTITPGVMIA